MNETGGRQGPPVKNRLRTTVLAIVISGVFAHGAAAQFLEQQTTPQRQAPQPANVDVQSIEALVNDEVISAYDVEQRVNLILSSVNANITPEQRQALRQQALQNLIDERLQLQEAASYDLVISDAELNQTLEMVAGQYEMSVDEFSAQLLRSGASIDALKAQIEAELAWSQLVRGRYRQQISVGDDEVQAVLKRLENNAGQSEYQVSEILLIVDSPSEERDMRRRADQILAQLENGVPFNVMARQFSQAATAAVGGDLGWVSEGQIPDEVYKALSGMRVNDYSAPIRTPGGYTILHLRDRRKILSSDESDTRLTLHQFLFETAEGESAEAAGARATRAVSSIRTCEEIPGNADAIGATVSSPVGVVRLGDLPGAVQEVVEELPVGTPSTPLPAPQGVRILMVCEREVPEVGMPTFETISESLTQQRLSLMARRYLRDLRRDAIIDYR